MFLCNTDVLSQDTETTTIAPIAQTTNPPTTESTVATPTEPATTATSTTESATTATTPTEPATTPTPTTLPCGGPGWRRVAFINMADLNQDCPQGLSLTDYSIRSCGRSQTGQLTCSSTIFPVDSEYSLVCGRATAYRWGHNIAFWASYIGRNINDAYVDGLSLTHGSPRTHIWTFASGEFNGSNDVTTTYCPCEPGNTRSPPSFVGNDYFCDRVATVSSYDSDANTYRFFSDNALWDGQDLLNPCYGLNNPPWFNKTLPVPTTDDIELRVCVGNPGQSANVAINLFELYVY